MSLQQAEKVLEVARLTFEETRLDLADQLCRLATKLAREALPEIQGAPELLRKVDTITAESCQLQKDLEDARKGSEAPVDPYVEAARVIRACISSARAQRIKVRPGTVGLQQGEYSGQWVEDPGEEGISPIGAVLLKNGADERWSDPHAAAADLMGVSLAWVQGVDDGFNDRLLVYVSAPHERALYWDGVEFGQTLRGEIRQWQ
jgi:hypothetical protein